MLRLINPLCRRAAPTLCALLFLTTPGVAHGFARKPVVPSPAPKPAPTPTPTPAPAPQPDPVDSSEIIRARWEAKSNDGPSWSRHVFETLPVLAPNLINKRPADIKDFCPAYDDLNARDKKNFWVYLLSSMTELESNHNPAVQYVEAFYDAKGRRVVSRGLLQISIESGNAYGCGFKTETELHDPIKNLDCGLRILNKWIGGDGRITGYSSSLGKYLGGARYWSVLRKDPNLGKIKAWNQALRMCQT